MPWPRNERGALAGLKTTSYAENVVALAYAQERGAGEAVFANLAGHLCEGTGSNVFYVVDGELRTPTLASGCLAGISRALLLEWYGGREVDEPVEVLDEADEIFLVSHDARRPGRDALRRPRAGRSGTGDAGVPEGVGRAGGRGRRPLSRPVGSGGGALALAVGRDVQPVAAGAGVAVALGAVAGQVDEHLVAVGGLAPAQPLALAGGDDLGEGHPAVDREVLGQGGAGREVVDVPVDSRRGRSAEG